MNPDIKISAATDLASSLVEKVIQFRSAMSIEQSRWTIPAPADNLRFLREEATEVARELSKLNTTYARNSHRSVDALVVEVGDCALMWATCINYLGLHKASKEPFVRSVYEVLADPNLPHTVPAEDVICFHASQAVLCYLELVNQTYPQRSTFRRLNADLGTVFWGMLEISQKNGLGLEYCLGKSLTKQFNNHWPAGVSHLPYSFWFLD